MNREVFFDGGLATGSGLITAVNTALIAEAPLEVLARYPQSLVLAAFTAAITIERTHHVVEHFMSDSQSAP